MNHIKDSTTDDSQTKNNIWLRPLSFSDKKLINKWLQDPYILKLTFVVPTPESKRYINFSNESVDRYMNILIKDSSRKTFAIQVNDVHIGNIGLKEYFPYRNSCECFIEIGESSYRGIGAGTAAMTLLLDYAFNTLKLTAMRLEVLDFNYSAIRVYEKLGFIHIGKSGSHYNDNDTLSNVLSMAITDIQWKYQKQTINNKLRFNIFPYL